MFLFFHFFYPKIIKLKQNIMFCQYFYVYIFLFFFMKKVILFGSGDLFFNFVDFLFQQGVNISAVISSKDEKIGRGNKIIFSTTKIFCEYKMIPYYQPCFLNNIKYISFFYFLKSDIIIVFNYGKLLDCNFLLFPNYSSINFHVSLLPMYRGASPISSSLVSNDLKSGISLILMDDCFDSGYVIFSKSFYNIFNYNFLVLTSKILSFLFECFFQVFILFFLKKNVCFFQDVFFLSLSYKLKKDNSIICIFDFCLKIKCNIIGISFWPSVIYCFQGEQFKILSSFLLFNSKRVHKIFVPGTILSFDITGIFTLSLDYFYIINDIQYFFGDNFNFVTIYNCKKNFFLSGKYFYKK